MKQFICDVLLTALVLAALLTAILLYKPDYDRVNNYTYKYNYMESHPDRINILLLGHSLCENSFNPHILGDSTFDLAVSARYMYYDVELARRYFPSMINLKVCIYPLAYETMINPTRYHYISISNHYNWMYLAPPAEYRDKIPHRPRIHHILYQKRRTCDDMGYDSLLEANVITKITLTQFRPEKCLDYIKELAQLCAEHGVRFIVVTPPCYMSAIEGVTQEGINIMHAIVDSANALYPIEYHDYLSDSTFQDEALYHNANHLNHRGATLFAERVKKDFGL